MKTPLPQVTAPVNACPAAVASLGPDRRVVANPYTQDEAFEPDQPLIIEGLLR